MNCNFNTGPSNTGRSDLYDDSAISLLPEGIRPGGLRLTEYLIELCGFKAGAGILDAGCGAGVSLDFIRSKYSLEVSGVDLSGSLIRRGHEAFPGLRLILGDVTHLPFFDGSFDGVLAECSLSVMDDPRKALSEISRVLADSGKLAISDVYLRRPELADSIRDLPLKGCISGAFIYDEIISMIKDSGFTPVLWEDHSKLWKEFVAGMILNDLSVPGMQACASSAGKDTGDWMSAVSQAKPGYFCLITEKRS